MCWWDHAVAMQLRLGIWGEPRPLPRHLAEAEAIARGAPPAPPPRRGAAGQEREGARKEGG